MSRKIYIRYKKYIFMEAHVALIQGYQREGTSNPFCNCSRYCLRHSILSAGLLYGSQTGSPIKYLFAFM